MQVCFKYYLAVQIDEELVYRLIMELVRVLDVVLIKSIRLGDKYRKSVARPSSRSPSLLPLIIW